MIWWCWQLADIWWATVESCWQDLLSLILWEVTQSHACFSCMVASLIFQKGLIPGKKKQIELLRPLHVALRRPGSRLYMYSTWVALFLLKIILSSSDTQICNLCKQFWRRSGPTKHGARSWSNLHVLDTDEIPEQNVKKNSRQKSMKLPSVQRANKILFFWFQGSSPIWEDFTSKATKLHSSLK